MSNRRKFIQDTGTWLLGAGLLGTFSACGNRLTEAQALAMTPGKDRDLFFQLSLAEWSLHRTLWSGELQHLDFPAFCRDTFGIGAVEYVSTFFEGKVAQTNYLAKLKKNADEAGVQNVLIMVDAEGSLATADEKSRLQAVENHKKWIRAAQFLDCHSIRVNAAGKGDREKVLAAAVDSLGRLSELAAGAGINIVVENHGGYSSDARWLAEVMGQVNRPNCGTLPDFGNFTVNMFPYQTYDPYQGVKELMPFAKGVSAKTKEFAPDGTETRLDFQRLLKLVKEAGYRGHIGIEYEGYKLSEVAGIKATQALLIQAGRQIG